MWYGRNICFKIFVNFGSISSIKKLFEGKEEEVGHATENLCKGFLQRCNLREEINLTLHTDSSQPSFPFDKNEN